jgi:hypothetical protein
MKLKYEKYKDENEAYFYELEMESGTKCMVPQELGDYVHKLEQFKNAIIE